MIEQFRRENSSPIHRAIAYIGIGEKELSLEEMETGYQQQDKLMHYIPQWYWFFVELKDDPRYQAIWEKLGLQEAWARMLKQVQETR